MTVVSVASLAFCFELEGCIFRLHPVLEFLATALVDTAISRLMIIDLDLRGDYCLCALVVGS